MSEWIPTSDQERLPELGALVIVGNCRNHVVRAGWRTLSAAYPDEWHWRTDDGSGVRQSHFTHWRPIPPGPSVQK